MLDSVHAYKGTSTFWGEGMDEKSDGSRSAGIEQAGNPPPRLLVLVREAIRRRHYSRRTEQAYVHWVKRFVCFHDKRHPREMVRPRSTAFLNDLASARNVAGVLSGLRGEAWSNF